MTTNTECWTGRWWPRLMVQSKPSETCSTVNTQRAICYISPVQHRVDLCTVIYLCFQAHSPHPVTTLKLLYLPITLCSVYLMDSQQLAAQSAMVLTQPTVTYPTLTVLWLVVLLPSHQHWLETLPTTLCPQPLGLWPQNFVDLSPPAPHKTLWCQM